MDLVDLPLYGGKFTQHKYVGCREISDHSPIWLKGSVRNWGPKPFKFFNAWVDHKEFLPFVSKSWGSMSFKGSVAYILKEKLKNLKNLLKQLNLEVFDTIDLKVREAVSNLYDLDIKA
ncbi:hypothetical protein KIW84_023097 [Lathyrus oleraceus]|uniref:Cysteine-rich receptor-like protein kinase n=1 Tax=Pisum sativum TaxID=3888 RepID=A0A9D4YC41_PEA|nr:hypothetical protein KIW84_023097 [Pisum sativum]